MHLQTADFARALGETYTTVRNVYGRPGREPRHPGEESFTPANHRKFWWIDAVAWRITRHLCELGLAWDDAAEAARREYAAHWALRQPNDAAGKFFAVWANVTFAKGTAPQTEHTLCTFIGTPGEIAEVLALDAAAVATGAQLYTGVANLRMVSLHRSIVTARLIARDGGFEPDGDGFRRIDGELVKEAGQ